MKKRSSHVLSPMVVQISDEAPVRSSHRNRTFAVSDSPLLSRTPQVTSESNTPTPTLNPQIVSRRRDSQKKKTVSFNQKPEDRRPSALLTVPINNVANPPNNPQKRATIVETIPLETKLLGDEVIPIEREASLNYVISPLCVTDFENDIDQENLKKLIARFPSEKFTLVKSENSEFYKISTIREEEESEMDESKWTANKKASKLLVEAVNPETSDESNSKIPKYSSKFLIEELFGEKEDSLDSQSHSSSSDSEGEENKSIHCRGSKKKKPPPPLSKNQEKKKVIYNYMQDFMHKTLDNKDDIHENIEENTELKRDVTSIPQLFRQHTRLLTKRKADFLKVVTMNPIERIHIDYDVFPDKYPMKCFRKHTLLLIRYLQKGSEIIVKSKLFEILSLIAVFLNCLTYILMRNRKGNYNEYLSQLATLRDLIFFFFLLEMFLKIFGSGILAAKNSYFKDGWNILDLIVNLGCFLNYTQLWISLDLSLLRTFRVMRPLKTISSLKKLQIILMALFAAVPLLLDVFIILLFFFLMYAIAGLQLFSGVLKYRCLDSATGLPYEKDEDSVCGNINCRPDAFCSKGIQNLISNGIINFDNLAYSFLQVLFIITLDSWTVIMYNIQKSVTNYAWVYFVTLVVAGSYVLTNLTLAVIKVKFSETHKHITQGETIRKKKTLNETQTYDFTQIKRHGLWFKKRAPELGEVPISQKKMPNIVTINVDALVENSEASGSKSVSKMSKTSRLSFSRFQSNSPDQSKMNSINPQKMVGKKETPSYLQNPTFNNNKLGSVMASKPHDDSSGALYRASIISHFEFEEENIIKRTIKKTLTKLNIGLQQNFLRFFNYRKRQRKMPKKALQKIQPKYLKLFVDFDREAETLSLNDVLPSRDENIKKQKIEKQLTVIKKARLPIIYTLRKNSNFFFELLKKVQEHRGSVNTENFGSETSSNDLFNHIQKKSIKSLRSQKSKATIIPISTTKRSSKNLEMLKSMKTQKIPENGNNMIFTLKKNEGRIGDQMRKSTVSTQMKAPSISLSRNAGYGIFEMASSVKQDPRKSTIKSQIKPNVKNPEEIGSMVFSNYLNKPNHNASHHRLSQLLPPSNLYNPSQYEKKKEIPTKDLTKDVSLKERKWTKEQEVMFSLVVGKSKDVDYNFVSIMINAAIENEDEETNFLNEHKEDEIDVEKHYLQIRKKDMQSEKMVSYIWSGEDVLKHTYNLRIFEKIFNALNQINLPKFIEESKGKFRILRRILRMMVENKFFKGLMIFIILTYIIIAALEGLISDSALYYSNMTFLLIFFIEFCLKIIGYGFKGYFRDKMNIFDFSILNLSLLEFLFIEENFLLIFRYIRFLTAFKILRIGRLFYEIKFLNFLFSILSGSLSSFIYLAGLFLLLNFVYALVGMQLFGGFLNPKDPDYNTFNFDTFWVAFLTVFDIVTLDNWITILRLLYDSEKTPVVSNVYLISWIFLGNFALLNLFLAILLDGFTQSLEEEEKVKIIDEEHKDIENEELFDFLGNQELQIVIPKDAREAFMEELTKEYLKYTKLNPNVSTNTDAHIIEDLIAETEKETIKPERSNTLSESKCENTFFIFSKDNPFRLLSFRILESHQFKNFLIFTLFWACLVILLETYTDRKSDEGYEVDFVILIKVMNSLILLIFLMEIIFKSLVNGFCLEKKSFMRSLVNVLDLVIVFSYFVDLVYFEQDFGFNISSIIRSIRILRPLRFITINKGLRLVVNALRESLSAIINVTLLLISLWTAYCILGIILYRDRFGFCLHRLNFGIGKKQGLKCGEENWVNYRYNFDNIFNGMITLFVVSTFDGWDEIMNVASNSDIAENGPKEFNNQYSSYIYFLTFIILVSMFMINLFIGVIFYNFSLASRRTKHKFLTDSQYYWLQLQKFILFAEPDLEMTPPKEGSFRYYVYFIVNSKAFEILINVCLILNIIVLAMPFDGASRKYLKALFYIHYFFNILFISEAIFKIFLHGFAKYIGNYWNRYDFFVVLTAGVDIFIQYYIGAFLKMIRLGDQIVKGLRVVRIIRLLRLVRKSKGVEKLIYILMISLPMVFNICLLCILIYYIYIIFGCDIFRTISKGVIFDEYVNFKNAAYAIMTLFRVSTADNWGFIIFDTMDQIHPLSALYFISFYIITSYILINLFILVLLQQFENYSLNPNNPLHTFKDYIAKFREVWAKFIDIKQPSKMHQKYLLRFFTDLKPPLGFHKDEEIDIVLKEISKMKLINDKFGFTYFNELLYCTLKRTYEAQINSGSNELALKELDKMEEKTRMKLHIKKKKKKFSDMIRNSLNISKYMDNFLNQNLGEYSPLPQYYTCKIIIYTWKRYTDITFEKLIKQEFDNVDYYESGSDTSEEKLTTYNQAFHVEHFPSLQ